MGSIMSYRVLGIRQNVPRIAPVSRGDVKLRNAFMRSFHRCFSFFLSVIARGFLYVHNNYIGVLFIQGDSTINSTLEIYFW